ncbi:hypothetical protein C0991_005068 [Blastosporella zonata]|nr:hypothetical protein C0991_005068 [Blastosporella zonata]
MRIPSSSSFVLAAALVASSSTPALAAPAPAPTEGGITTSTSNQHIASRNINIVHRAADQDGTQDQPPAASEGEDVVFLCKPDHGDEQSKAPNARRDTQEPAVDSPSSSGMPTQTTTSLAPPASAAPTPNNTPSLRAADIGATLGQATDPVIKIVNGLPVVGSTAGDKVKGIPTTVGGAVPAQGVLGSVPAPPAGLAAAAIPGPPAPPAPPAPPSGAPSPPSGAPAPPSGAPAPPSGAPAPPSGAPAPPTGVVPARPLPPESIGIHPVGIRFSLQYSTIERVIRAVLQIPAMNSENKDFEDEGLELSKRYANSEFPKPPTHLEAGDCGSVLIEKVKLVRQLKNRHITMIRYAHCRPIAKNK